jgi:N-acetylglucosamine kinase-like BadF-type ATPase
LSRPIFKTDGVLLRGATAAGVENANGHIAMDTAYFLGVDGGATRCRARVRGCSGERLADAEGPAANIYVDFDGALAVVHEVVSGAMVGAGLSTDDRARTALGFGLAGVSEELTAAQVIAAILLVGGAAPKMAER